MHCNFLSIRRCRNISFIKPEKIAEELKVSPATVRAWLRKGELKGIKVGSLWRIKEEDYKKYLNEKEKERE